MGHSYVGLGIGGLERKKGRRGQGRNGAIVVRCEVQDVRIGPMSRAMISYDS